MFCNVVKRHWQVFIKFIKSQSITRVKWWFWSMISDVVLKIIDTVVKSFLFSWKNELALTHERAARIGKYWAGDQGVKCTVWSGFDSSSVSFLGWLCCWFSHCFEGLSPGSPVLLSLQKPTSPKFSLTKLEPVQANVLSLKYCNLFTILFIYFKSRYFPFRSHLVTWLSPTTIFVLAFDWKFPKGFWRILKKIEIENARQEQIKNEKLEIFLQYGLKCTDRCYLNPSNPYLRVIAWSKARTWSSFYAGRWSLAAKYFPCIHRNDLYYMASSVGGQDEPSPTLWLATRAGKSELSCPLGTTRCIPQAKFLRKPYIPFIDQAFSVKMTDIGLVLFLRGQYLAILTSHLANSPFV